MHIKTERTCIACRKKDIQKNLIRIVYKDKQIYIDNQKVIGGRAVYACNNEMCLNKIKKSKLLNRAFKSQIDENEYTKLK